MEWTDERNHWILCPSYVFFYLYFYSNIVAPQQRERLLMPLGHQIIVPKLIFGSLRVSLRAQEFQLWRFLSNQ